jgi:hypothetical protein
MKSSPRPGYGLFQLLVVLGLLLLLMGVMLPALQKVRIAAARMKSANNLKQIALGTIGSADANNGDLPAGVDDKQFSALFYILPYVEQDHVYKLADKTKDSDDKANAKARSTRIATFESPLDPVSETGPAGGTNYFAMAGSKMSLEKNDGAFFRETKNKFPASFADGTSNTVLFVEMLRGDDGKKAVTVQRQHVRRKAGDLGTLKGVDGVKGFADGKNIAADRGSAWIDGRFLRATTNATLGMMDERPDVDCGGEGGVAGVRMPADGTNVGIADGSVRWTTPKLSLVTWKAASTTSGGEVLGEDW